MCEAPEKASGMCSLRAKAFWKVKPLQIFYHFLHLFLIKPAMAEGINCLFEQDPPFPHFGSRKEQVAFSSAMSALSTDKKSCPVPTAGGPFRKPRRSKVVLKMQYSRQGKRFQSDSDDDEPIFNFEDDDGAVEVMRRRSR